MSGSGASSKVGIVSTSITLLVPTTQIPRCKRHSVVAPNAGHLAGANDALPVRPAGDCRSQWGQQEAALPSKPPTIYS